MKKLAIIIICCLFLFSCASVQKSESEVPNPAGKYIEKVKKDPLGEIINWLEAISVAAEASF